MAYGYELRNALGNDLALNGLLPMEVWATGTATGAGLVTFPTAPVVPLIFVRPLAAGLFGKMSGLGFGTPLNTYITKSQFAKGMVNTYFPFNHVDSIYAQGMWAGPAAPSFKWVAVVPKQSIPSGHGMVLYSDNGTFSFDSQGKKFIIDYVYQNNSTGDFDFTVTLNAPYPGHERYFLLNPLVTARYRVVELSGFWYDYISKMEIVDETHVRFRRAAERYDGDGNDPDVGMWGDGVLRDAILYPMMTGFLKV